MDYIPGLFTPSSSPSSLLVSRLPTSGKKKPKKQKKTLPQTERRAAAFKEPGAEIICFHLSSLFPLFIFIPSPSAGVPCLSQWERSPFPTHTPSPTCIISLTLPAALLPVPKGTENVVVLVLERRVCPVPVPVSSSDSVTPFFTIPAFFLTEKLSRHPPYSQDIVPSQSAPAASPASASRLRAHLLKNHLLCQIS